jgi:hypothetical protein
MGRVPRRASRAGNRPRAVTKRLRGRRRRTDARASEATIPTLVATNPSARLRDIAATVGITERTATQIVNDLDRDGYLTKTRVGRRNTYKVHDELPLRHPRHRDHTVGELIRFVANARVRGVDKAIS